MCLVLFIMEKEHSSIIILVFSCVILNYYYRKRKAHYSVAKRGRALELAKVLKGQGTAMALLLHCSAEMILLQLVGCGRRRFYDGDKKFHLVGHQ